MLSRLDAAWTAFRSAYDGMSNEQLLEPGVAGDWSVKDLIAHVSWWEEEALTHLPHIAAGGRPPRYSAKYSGIDAFNALMADRKRELSLAEVLRQAAETHERLVAYVGSVPEEHFVRETRFRRRLRLDTFAHYPIHARAIRRWRERAGG